MANQEQEAIVIECRRLACELNQKCGEWLHTATNRRAESAAFDLSSSADALYSFINDHPEIMGSDTGQPAFDDPGNDEFQSDMESLWDQPEPDFRERRIK
jgi:hypothetical protein